MLRIPRRWLAAAAVPLICAGAAVVLHQPQAYAATTATIDGTTSYQPIDGFGISEAFGRTSVIRSMSTTNQQQVLDLLFSRSTGAGLSILRNGISSTGSSIQPTNPGGPNATPRYVWNGDDDGQVWLSKKAQEYGVDRFYANAWSAPGYMKTNNDEANGGSLCGLQGASCGSGDWRRAYANYLIQYTRYYAQEGIPITDLGFTNEPNYTTDYSSMRFTPAQAAEFTKIIGPLAGAAGLKLACCDPVGWNDQRSYASAIMADSEANRWVTTHTGHHYSSAPTSPLSVGGKRTWMSEWSPGGSSSSWNTNWDDGSGIDGFTVANSLHTALTAGNVNGYVYWYGVSTNNTRAFIQGNGSNYTVSKRLWAMAGYSRYIRPGATRIGASSPDSNLRLSAYRNTDGSVVVVALNAGNSAQSTAFTLRNSVTGGSATGYLTNNSNGMTPQSAVGISNGAFNATVPARSMVTYRITGDTTPPPTTPPPTTPPPTTPPPTTPPPGGSGCAATYQVTNSWQGGFQADVSVANTGASTTSGWRVSWTLPSGQSISQAWNGTLTTSGSTATVTNASYNGSLAPGARTTFGFIANGSPGSPPTLSCTST
ncbi:cellulose binding domain-containing protein [Micromonospora sp. NBC_01638]|uniref:cellulose binding domain-containing protein n=1 Tax=Micromonospora sp. NBC_01638 TaxID=2975982 RepID=UPI0038635E23|nr:cellulose binding domain-containing protein [Micromonospora sp. NBC_01638]